ncbi:LL-diaminopimelate aminotransferase [uncultured Maricaulis sp.]|uniref:LL-diaminopimelate aminotransferase n=1 Tax=uncultured Maricaulis sp. TaxID=174710 RepID=UPI0030D96A97|tara:strand:- start:15123 stop:16316 length:1194 start_codon:yes stop_codon:yes gene_type:complete
MEFHRTKRLPPYVFEEVNRLKAQLRAKGADIIDFGMGNPDLPTPAHVLAKLKETADKPHTNGYSASRGIPGLRKAQARYYKRRFDVELDPDSEVIVTLGSKEGFANLAQAITAPGDVVLAPSPSYPIHTFGFLIAGGTIRHVNAASPDEYLRGLKHAVRHTVPKPIAVVVCYPSNPTAQTATLDFYKQVVEFAREHDLFILSDLAYAEVYFGDTPTPSMLQIEGAKERTIEFTSMSKTYSMAGFRVGFAAGSPRLVAALARVKSYLDYGAYTPVQVAACAALDGPQDCVDEMRAIYKHRRDVLVESFGRIGWKIPVPEASMFAWAPLPDGCEAMGSLEFAKQLMEEAGVAVAPGIGFGEHGEGYVRLALVENEQRIRQAARGVGEFLKTRQPAIRAV